MTLKIARTKNSKYGNGQYLLESTPTINNNRLKESDWIFILLKYKINPKKLSISHSDVIIVEEFGVKLAEDKNYNLFNVENTTILDLRISINEKQTLITNWEFIQRDVDLIK